MVFTWYKKLFSVTTCYETAGAPSPAGISLEPCGPTRSLFDIHGIRCRGNPGQIDVYVPVIQADESPALTPLFQLAQGEHLFFNVNFADPGLIEKLLFFPGPAAGSGFPCLYTGNSRTSASFS